MPNSKTNRPFLPEQNPPDDVPFCAMDHYMWSDTIPFNSFGDCYRLTLRGLLNKELFLKALRASLKRHPILKSKLRGKKNWRTRKIKWLIQSEEFMPYVSWGNQADAIEIPENKERLINLNQEAGLRIYVREGKGETQLYLQIHHSTADATGVQRFIEDLFALYLMELYPGNKNYLRPLSVPPRSEHERYRGAKNIKKKTLLTGICKFLFYFPTMVLSQGKGLGVGENHPREWPPGFSFQLSREDTQRILNGARRDGVTVNDLLVRNLFFTIHEWNQSILPGNRSRIRIAVPVNLRANGQGDLSAINLFGLCFVDRNSDQIGRNDEFLKGISKDIKKIKKDLGGMSLIYLMRISGSYWGGIHQGLKMLNRIKNNSTSVLTNFGTVFKNTLIPMKDGLLQIGDAIITKVEHFVDGRSKNPVTLSAINYGGRLTLSFNYNPKLISLSEAKTLFANFLAELDIPQGLDDGQAGDFVSRIE